MQAKPCLASSAGNEVIMTFWAKRLPVWQFHALALVALVLGGVFVVGWWPGRYPDEVSIIVIVFLPLFTLEGVDGEFRYPRTHPKNLIVRNRTSHALDVWVERSTIGSDEPMVIWQIREHNPYKKEHQDILAGETFVSHAEIVQRLMKIDRSMVEAGAWLV